MAKDEHAARTPRARDESRERRDIVSGEIFPEHRLIRFVAAPDGQVVPDVAARLPGRGLWVEASRKSIAIAIEKKLFARAAKAPGGGAAKNISTGTDLMERTERALVTRMLGDLGLARRSGALVLGFDNVLRALDGPNPPALLIEAADGSHDGKRKLYNAAHARDLKPVVVECLLSAELGLALGRENVIHAAVQRGGLAERLTLDARRLAALRSERDS
ncbi:MAG TPA: RNA-binding protein [Rhizomicrobium sp.]|nr:RNA-binding protein [Rhizomicrobium sp.]